MAGFESVSVALCFIAHELAVNPDAQKKLQEEIDRVCQELHDKQKTLDYEAINQMKYLDMVISGKKYCKEVKLLAVLKYLNCRGITSLATVTVY